MRVGRPYWDREAFEQGERKTGRCINSGPCEVCGETATRQFCESECPGDPLDQWHTLCFEHRNVPLLNWRDSTEKLVRLALKLEEVQVETSAQSQ